MWLGMVAGAESGRDIFTRLMLPSDRSPAREATLLTAEQTSQEAEVRLELRNAGEYARELAQILGVGLGAERARSLACVGSATLVLGRGSSLPMAEYSLQVGALRRWEAAWTAKARPELVPAIRRAFRKQEQVCKEDLLHALESHPVAPIYLTLSAEQGQERDFADAHRRLAEFLGQMAELGAGVQCVEYGDFRGIRMSQRRAWEFFTGRKLRDPDVCRALDRKGVYLLTTLRGGTAITILCEHPTDIALPRTLREGVPQPAASDETTHELLASLYASTELCRAWQTALRLRRLNLAQACVNALREASMDDPQHAAAYNAAQEALCELVACFGPTPLSKTPLSVQIWQTDGGILAEGETDALQASFAPGTLRQTEQADAPGSFFYLESTAFTCPLADIDRGGIVEKLPTVYRGMALTLKPEARRRPEKYATSIRMFGEELEGVGDAVGTMLGGIQAPLAVIAVHASREGAPPAWALCARVKKRAALSAGWRQMLSCVGRGLEKLGVPPMVTNVLPIKHGRVANLAETYSIVLPFVSGMFPSNVTLNDRDVILGNDEALSARLIASTAGNMPYCGAVSSVHLPTLAAIVNSKHRFRPQVKALLARLAQHFVHLYAVSSIDNGIFSVRAFLSASNR